MDSSKKLQMGGGGRRCRGQNSRKFGDDLNGWSPSPYSPEVNGYNSDRICDMLDKVEIF